MSKIRCDVCGCESPNAAIGTTCELCTEGILAVAPDPTSAPTPPLSTLLVSDLRPTPTIARHTAPRPAPPPPPPPSSSPLPSDSSPELEFSPGNRLVRPYYILAGIAAAVLLAGVVVAGYSSSSPQSPQKAPKKALQKEAEPPPAPSSSGPGLVGTSAPTPRVCSSNLREKYSYQLASKFSLSDALKLRADVLNSPVYLEFPGSAYIVYKDPYYVVMAGEFDHESDASQTFTDATNILRQGGFIRSMAKFCDEITPATKDYCTCIEY